jgi:hypothetical protein
MRRRREEEGIEGRRRREEERRGEKRRKEEGGGGGGRRKRREEDEMKRGRGGTMKDEGGTREGRGRDKGGTRGLLELVTSRLYDGKDLGHGSQLTDDGGVQLEVFFQENQDCYPGKQKKENSGQNWKICDRFYHFQ